MNQTFYSTNSNFNNTMNKASFFLSKKPDFYDKSSEKSQMDEEKLHKAAIQSIIQDLENDIEESPFILKEELNLKLKEFTLDFNRMQ